MILWIYSETSLQFEDKSTIKLCESLACIKHFLKDHAVKPQIIIEYFLLPLYDMVTFITYIPYSNFFFNIFLLLKSVTVYLVIL
jgi:hypothetical protein